MVVGPITGASLNPARAFAPELVSAIGGGATHWGQLIPVYVLPGLVGSGLAAFAYDLIAEPRRVGRPIKSAVTTPESPTAAAVKREGPRWPPPPRRCASCSTTR